MSLQGAESKVLICLSLKKPEMSTGKPLGSQKDLALDLAI